MGNLSASENRISVQGMPTGVYFLRLVDGETSDEITKKILVNR